MEYSPVQLYDLPDEILIFIFKKLTNVEVLYSLIGVNKQLNKIVHDSIFTCDLTISKNIFNNSVYPSPDRVLDRFCLQIIPEIHHKIKWLHLESSCLKRVLLSANYPNLFGLGVYNIEKEHVLRLFTDDNSCIDKLKNQISSLVIDVVNPAIQFKEDFHALILMNVSTMFTNLQSFNYNPSSLSCSSLSFDIPPLHIFSSTLLELYIQVRDFEDCLYLLDGRFNQLRTFYVDVGNSIRNSNLIVTDKTKLPNLRCFSLSYQMSTSVYDEIIMPFLHRMSNLENLFLYIVTYRRTIIDGNELKTNIIDHMPRLNKFIFNIQSIHSLDEIALLSHHDLQYSFRDFKDNQIISYLNYFRNADRAHCHVYSDPCTMKYYYNIANNFPGGLFKSVQYVSLYDEHPFEHEFFLRIAQSFPLMKKLTVVNWKNQQNKRCQKSKDDNQDLSIIKYPHLIDLTLDLVHNDYLDQFLSDTKTYLPNGIWLSVHHQSLKKVTRNFKRNSMRINCSQVNRLYVYDDPKVTKRCKNYFPRAEIFL